MTGRQGAHLLPQRWCSLIITGPNTFRIAMRAPWGIWTDTQPDPFRRFEGAPVTRLLLSEPDHEPLYEPAFVPGNVEVAAVDLKSISQLFRDSLGLSAWKEFGEARWSLRVNPSSGNLHPTEGYLIAGPIQGITDEPAVYHYAPKEHTLEKRCVLARQAWQDLADGRNDIVFVALTSIHWRESWKYGERAFRYCHHDVGHAIGSVAIGAAGLGWNARLVANVTDSALAHLLGVHGQSGPEAEHPDCLLVLSPQGSDFAGNATIRLDQLGALSWSGTPNRLSAEHHPWPVIDDVNEAAIFDEAPPVTFWEDERPQNASLEIGQAPLSLRRIIHQRRSAVAMDGRTGITRDAFYQILLKTVPGRDQIPHATLPWKPHIDLLLFVHRVEGIEPGLYAMVRNADRVGVLKSLLDDCFDWTRPEHSPESLDLYQLKVGDCRGHAAGASCGQDIASDGVFAVAMLAEFRDPIERLGGWFYKSLHWEAGLLGQMLYLEAEASGIRSTGIGCFYDDETHRIFGIEGDSHQVIYHFTLGGAVEDTRLQTHPPYAHLTDRD